MKQATTQRFPPGWSEKKVRAVIAHLFFQFIPAAAQTFFRKFPVGNILRSSNVAIRLSLVVIKIASLSGQLANAAIA